jgi:hypothetical protein
MTEINFTLFLVKRAGREDCAAVNRHQPNDTMTATQVTYSAKIVRRFKTGDQFGRIRKGSKIQRDMEVFASDGTAVPRHLFDGLELLSAAKLLCDCLNSGMTFDQANRIEFDFAARCKETVSQLLARTAQF